MINQHERAREREGGVGGTVCRDIYWYVNLCVSLCLFQWWCYEGKEFILIVTCIRFNSRG